MLEHAPKDWPIKRISQLFKERKEKVSDRDFPPLSVTKKGILSQLDTAAKTDDGDNRKGVRAGDFVINSRSDRKSSGGVSDRKGSVSLINLVLEPRGIYPRFAHHLLRSTAFQEEFYRWGHGIVADLWTTRYSKMKNIRIAIPECKTQQAIANFLDCEITRIDQLIEKKRTLLDLLEEKRQVLITRVVTKGLNPDTPMKPSGIDWLGDIPAHWEVFRLKLLASEPLTYGANAAADLGEPDWPRFVRITDIDDLGRLRPETYRSLPPDIAEGFLLKENDILLARSGATVGKSFIYDPSWGIACYAGYLVRARIKKTNSARFIYWFMKSVSYREWVRSNFIQNTIQNISSERYANLCIPMPPLDMQRRIAQFLDKQTEQLNGLSAKVHKSIEKLTEYRAATITSAVTGQLTDLQ